MSVLSTIGAAVERIKAASFGSYGETTGYSPDRSNIMFYLPADSRMYLDSYTRNEINRKTEWLYQNFGVVKEGVRGIARHTVGKGVSLQINSEDEDFNEAAEADFEDMALSPARFDIAGRRNFYEAQETACEQRMKLGEFLACHATNPRWNNEPCIQMFDNQEIVTPGEIADGIRVYDGVGVDTFNNPLRYYLSGNRKPIPASEMIHWYKPDGINQVRGASEFAQAVNPLVDIYDLKKLTTKSAKLHAALAVMVKRSAKMGGQGAMSAIRQANTSGVGNGAVSGPGADDTTALERVFGGGAIAYVGNEGDIKMLSSSHPSPLVEPFITDLLMRDVCAGWGVPAEFFWCIAKLSGANTRFVLSKSDLFFQVFRDAMVWRFCNPIAVRYLLARIQSGKLQPCKDPDWLRKISWQGPPSLSVDESKTGALEINQLANGVETMQSINDKRGRNWRVQMRQWFKEWALARKIAKEEGAEFALPMYRAGVPGAASADVQPDADAADRSSQEDKEDLDTK